MPVSGYTPVYKIESPFRSTPVVGNFMAYYIHRRIDPQDNDIQATLDNQRYVERPDLLAFDLYQDSDLWWVFGVRNGFEDPVYDLQLGVEMYIPRPEYLRAII